MPGLPLPFSYSHLLLNPTLALFLPPPLGLVVLIASAELASFRALEYCNDVEAPRLCRRASRPIAL
jgi:hypothetical protein